MHFDESFVNLSLSQTAESVVHYLVDVENVANRWMDAIPVGEKAAVFLFYTEPSPCLSYGDLVKIRAICEDFHAFACEKGVDALDFQLSSYLGFLLSHAAQGDRFVIVSNDSGYDCICRFWNRQGYQVGRVCIPSMLRAAGLRTKGHTSPEVRQTGEAAGRGYDAASGESSCCVEMVRNCLRKQDKHFAEEICGIIQSHVYGNLQVIYQAFVKVYGQKQGLELYHCVRPLVARVQSQLLMEGSRLGPVANA